MGFWNDPDGRKFHDVYFDRYPNIWAHGDCGEITANGGSVIHGRAGEARGARAAQGSARASMLMHDQRNTGQSEVEIRRPATLDVFFNHDVQADGVRHRQVLVREFPE